MDRRQKILEHVDLAGEGLEIGALHHPILRRADAKVRYVDHADTDALLAKYDAHEEVEEVVDVDVVWSGNRLAEALAAAGGAQRVDFVVASHVIEHVPDLVGWLDQLAEVLRPGGVLALAIPDKRFCFDARRGTTSTADVVGAWLEGRTRPSAAAVYDFYSLLAEVDTAATWAGVRAHDDLPVESTRGMEHARRAAAGEYLDVHCWTFTDASFLTVLRDLATLGALPYEIVGHHPTEPGELEFHVSLARLDVDLPDEARKQRALRSIAAVEGVAPAVPDTVAVALSSRERRLIAAKRAAFGRLRRISGLLRR